MPVLSNWATPTDSEEGTLEDNTLPNFNILIVSPLAGAELNVRVVPDTVNASVQCWTTPDK